MNQLRAQAVLVLINVVGEGDNVSRWVTAARWALAATQEELTDVTEQL